jgi:hypothetical protein
MPLYRDSDATVANLAPKLTRTLSQFIGCSIDAADVISYVAAIVAHVDYTERFREQLKTPGIRVPITLDKDLWQEAVMVGRRVLWLHTYGSRMVNPKEGRPQGLGKTRRAKYIIHVPSGDAQLPTSIKYDDQSETLIIGDDTLFEHAGQVGPVRKETWEYKVGGVQIIRKWFSYRHPNPARRKRTSPLDNINPYRWTAGFDDELLDLLEVLDGCVALEPKQRELLDRICAGPTITVNDLEREGVLPAPAIYRKPPTKNDLDFLS